ncbi:MAG: hypothetical protein K1X75_11330 [Leptospirales bacterium]|nr:hypothetical protein [Leptospirales bacterium]
MALLAGMLTAALCCNRSGEDLPLGQRKTYDAAPSVEVAEVRWGPDGAPPGGEADVQAVFALLDAMVQMTFRQDLSELPQRVSQQDGLWVDLKAHRSFAELQAELADPGSYLRTAYLDTRGLRALSGNESSLSVRDVLRTTRKLRATLFMEASGQTCEAKLELADAPERSYYLNNPIFIKRDGVWYILRLF